MKQMYDKVLSIDISNEKKVKKIIDALNCKNRRDILNLLGNNIMSISEIADALNVPISTVSEHVKILINSGIVSVAGKKTSRGNSKVITRQYEKISISINGNEKNDNTKVFSQNIPVGTYSDFKINQYCGIIGEDGYIGARDDKKSFYSTNRFLAQLIWFDYGYLEYKIPIKKIDLKKIISISLSTEICSEAPGYNMDWKSDIFFEFNGVEVCTYTSPSDFGYRRGILTPEWWQGGTQYGLLKRIEIRNNGTYIDNELVSPITLQDINYGDEGIITFKIGVHENAKNCGGINIFGRKFGDYNQNIILTINYIE